MSRKKTIKKKSKSTKKKTNKKLNKKKTSKQKTAGKTTRKKVSKAVSKAVSNSAVMAELDELRTGLATILNAIIVLHGDVLRNGRSLEKITAPAPAKKTLKKAKPKTETLNETLNTKTETLNETPNTDNGQTDITKEQVSQALQELATTEGLDAVETVLKSFKATKISDLKPAQYPEVLSATFSFKKQTPPPVTDKTVTGTSDPLSFL